MAIINFVIHFFDILHHLWERHSTERAIGIALIWIYIVALAIVEANRLGFYPAWLPEPPDTLAFGINLAFSLILGFEVLSLIFILPASLSRSMGKQLEILTLILLRNAFKELHVLKEPISIDMDNLFIIVDIGASGVGAVCVFLLLGLYRSLGRKHASNCSPILLQSYVRAKKIVSFILLLFFAYLLVYCGHAFYLGKNVNFFETIYTILIFADIAMVLIAQRYMPGYYAVFRNSGFVIGTLLMRLSFSAPVILCAAIAVFAALYVFVLTWATNYFEPEA